jgi:hypothetical protein
MTFAKVPMNRSARHAWSVNTRYLSTFLGTVICFTTLSKVRNQTGGDAIALHIVRGISSASPISRVGMLLRGGPIHESRCLPRTAFPVECSIRRGS